MANAPKPKKGKGSTKSKSTTSKTESVKLVDPDEPTPLATSGCGCCNCADQPSWVLWTCEDGNCVPIFMPNFFSVLSFDPSQTPQLGPYMGKPSNFPVAELRDMFTNMISSMTPTQVMNLWAQLINGMTNTEKSGLAAALVGKLQCAPPPPATGSCTMTSI